MSNFKLDFVPKSAAKAANSPYFSLNLGLHVETLAQYANEKGFVNLNITERKEVGQYGDTHNVRVYVQDVIADTFDSLDDEAKARALQYMNKLANAGTSKP